MNEFLKNRGQIFIATDWLKDNGYTVHPIGCKDWELANVTKEIGDGDLLDMGADGSFVLHNAIKKGIKGRKVGIDLYEVKGDNKAEGAEYFQGDLMQTPFENNSFDTIVSLSVLEHQVDIGKFANEVSRLLRDRGQLFLSFDFWEPKLDTSKTKLYSLDWNVLCFNDVYKLINSLANNKIFLTSLLDTTLQDAVINPTYCSPTDVSYTFGLLHFQKTDK